MLKVNHLSYQYKTWTDNQERVVQALKNISLEIHVGEFVAILGSNGSGKSTLAKHLNGLIIPLEGNGEVLVDGVNTKDSEYTQEISSQVGLVFQNPNNQIIGTTVEEDIVFGPGNRGIPSNELRRIVDESLTIMELENFCRHSPDDLSGGQKQRLAIAGIIALKPHYIIFDEATSMIDTQGRVEVLEAAKKLNEAEGVTIIWITHLMDEVVDADRLILLKNGELVAEGSPQVLFVQTELIESIGLDLPKIVKLSRLLHDLESDFPFPLFDIEIFTDEIIKLAKGGRKHA